MNCRRRSLNDHKICCTWDNWPIQSHRPRSDNGNRPGEVKFVAIRNAHAKNYDFGPFPDFRTPWISMCIQKVAQKGGDLPPKAPQTNEPHLGCHHLLPSWLLHSQVWTPNQCIEPVSVSVFKKWREKEEIWLQNRANEWAPLRCHHLLPSWLLRSQVCTPTQSIEPVSVSVSK